MNIYIYDRYIHRCLYMHAACNTRDGESASGFGEEEEEEEEEAQDATVESPQSPDARCTARPSAALCASLHARCGLRWGRLRAAGGRRGNRSGGGGDGKPFAAEERRANSRSQRLFSALVRAVESTRIMARTVWHAWGEACYAVARHAR